ncbi:UDP-N-acetylglucosamine 1-carboxyvinyltransferase [Candidatus Peregrinibacteria bacterium]|nr:UDP-N-acetylglucosamine 1-carboxyvinyltransferase [Candidatus Peregrinibacteria bacterium]
MGKFVINGGKKLNGEIRVGGSKNASLPIICASLLCKGQSIIKNVPDISDIHSLLKILEHLGCSVKFQKNTVTINPEKLKSADINGELVCRMRASILLLGPMLARFKKVSMSYPGGCVLGKRPVDAHITALKELGCKVVDDKQHIILVAAQLNGADITMPEISVTATENAIMAAAFAKGKTVIRLAACEPHVQDLCGFLNKCGAKIKGVGTHELHIEGVKSLKACTYSVTGDYLEAGTYAIAAALTGGDVKITGIDPHDLDSFLQALKEAGVNFETNKSFIHIRPTKNIQAVAKIRTAVYPSFPTDLQAPFAVLLTQAKGESKIYETLFEGRLNYLFELEKMGARFEIINPHQAIIKGPRKLKGVPISSWDIRAGAAMILAALCADGKTEINNIEFIDRGYENIEDKLQSLGADIKRI